MPTTRSPLRIVIVGGVAGGATAAARARRVDPTAEITLVEKGPVVSFANCGLPYHLGGEIEQRQKLLVASADLFWSRFRIHVRTEHEVTSIDRANRTISGRRVSEASAAGELFEIPYDRLILATGSEPLRPDFYDATAENLFQLWTLGDMDRILSDLHHHPCRRAVVIGAGFVGLEVVEQLVRRGIDVTLVERLPQVLGPLDAELAQLVQEELIQQQVGLRLNAAVAALEREHQRISAVRLSSGESIATDLVIVGAGVRPRTQLAVQAGLTLGQAGGVAVNEFMQTDDPVIYAVGDMIEYHHGVLDKSMRIPLAGPANRAGRVAGTHAASGQSSPMGSVYGTSIVRVFGLTAGVTGLNARAARGAGLNFHVATIQAPHHASYFPGAKNLTLKIIYDAVDGKLIGAQAVGAAGVDKRLDVIATTLHFGGTIDDLADLDLAYAPPFGSAKDPIHMAAFVAENDLRQAPALMPFDSSLDGFQVLDVRTAAEIEKLPLPGAIHIPVDELPTRWQELDPQQPTVTVCHSGKRAHIAACWLQGHGFDNVKNLNGGMSIRRLSQP